MKEVYQAMENGNSITFGPMFGYIVNCDSPIGFPGEFTYLACTEVSEFNISCSKPVEGPNKCLHRSLEHGRYVDQYMFDVFFVDGGVGHDCPPLRATVFEAAGRALFGNQSADSYRFMDYKFQKATLRRIMDGIPYVEIVVRVSAGVATIEQLKVLREGNNAPRRTLHSQCTLMTSRTPHQGTESEVGSTPSATGFIPRDREKLTCSSAYNILRGEAEKLKATVKEMKSLVNSMLSETLKACRQDIW